MPRLRCGSELPRIVPPTSRHLCGRGFAIFTASSPLTRVASGRCRLARTAGDKGEEAFALCTLGLVAGLVEGAEAMRPYFEEARPLFPPPAHVAVGVRFLAGGFLPQMSFILLRWFQSDPEEPGAWPRRRSIAGGRADFPHWCSQACGSQD